MSGEQESYNFLTFNFYKVLVFIILIEKEKRKIEISGKV